MLRFKASIDDVQVKKTAGGPEIRIKLSTDLDNDVLSALSQRVGNDLAFSATLMQKSFDDADGEEAGEQLGLSPDEFGDTSDDDGDELTETDDEDDPLDDDLTGDPSDLTGDEEVPF